VKSEELEMPRIGREPNPAERGLQHVVENVHVLEHVSQNLLGSELGLSGFELGKRWSELTEEMREEWRVAALGRIREYVDQYRSDESPEPRPPEISRKELRHSHSARANIRLA
jgi:hypothetical protein